MTQSYPFPVWSGVLDPEHYKKIGSAIWLFLWCISSTTAEVERDGITWGIVLGNKPLKLDDLGKPFGVNKRTVQRWLETLEKHDYIKITRAPYGLILTVKNSKKFQAERVDKNVVSGHDKNVMSDRETTKMSTPDTTKMSHQDDKNVHSNKDITKINNTTITTTKNTANNHKEEGQKDAVDLIAERYIDLLTIQNGRPSYPTIEDYQAIVQVVVPGIPVSQTIELLDQCFEDFKKRKPNGRIKSFNYCKDYILDHYEKLKARENAKKMAERRITDGPVHQPSRSYGGFAKQSKTKEQVYRELEAARRAWGG